jgi:CPA2 family monovalent cation:H+ antiporter-2
MSRWQLTHALFAAADADMPWVFIELGAAVIGLALLARLAHRLGFSAIPLYLLGGLAFGNGGLVPLRFSEEFLHVGAEVGVILLLFMLGLEYSGDELLTNLRRGLAAGLADLLLNFPPGLVAGWLLGWGPLASVLLGGVTYVSSSGIVARVLTELGRMDCPETPTVLSVLVLEDLAMAVFLPVVAVLLAGQGVGAGLVGVLVALATVAVVLLVALRYGKVMSRLVAHHSDEVVLLSAFGLVLAVAGLTQWLQVSSAVGAFLVGVALSGPVAQRTHRLLGPVRDLFAALFFLFFGLQIDPSTLPPVLWQAAALGVVTTATKFLSGWWATRHAGLDWRSALRAGAALDARGEFSVVIAGLGVGAGLEPQLGPLSAAYVLFLAALGPLLTRWADVSRRQESADGGNSGLARIIQSLRRTSAVRRPPALGAGAFRQGFPLWAHRPLTPTRGSHGDGLSDGSAGGVNNGRRDGVTQPLAHAAIPIQVRPTR